ncbi:MAG TPA: hypothetical protein VGG07_13610 [Solirubrobacteraceae bacterium]
MSARALLPWVLPGTIIVAVLVATVAGSVLLGILLMLVGYVGVPMAYLAYSRTRQELREGAPTGATRRSRPGRTRR